MNKCLLSTVVSIGVAMTMTILPARERKARDADVNSY
jgi:hypothetical protein